MGEGDHSRGITLKGGASDARAAVSSRDRGGVESQGISLPGNLRPEAIAYLLVDCSTSMASGNKIDQAKNGAKEFAEDAKTKGYDVGLIKFSNIVTHVCEPQSDVSSLSRCLNELVAMGSTNMAGALSLAFEKLKNEKGRKVAVLITDGEPTEGEPDPKEAAIRVALKMKDYGIDLITIGTDDADEGFLKRLATRTNLSVMVKREQLQRGISSAAGLLPGSSKRTP